MTNLPHCLSSSPKKNDGIQWKATSIILKLTSRGYSRISWSTRLKTADTSKRIRAAKLLRSAADGMSMEGARWRTPCNDRNRPDQTDNGERAEVSQWPAETVHTIPTNLRWIDTSLLQQNEAPISSHWAWLTTPWSRQNNGQTVVIGWARQGSAQPDKQSASRCTSEPDPPPGTY